MAWSKYKEIQIKTQGIPASDDLDDFPIPVRITGDTDIASELSGGGGVKFTTADGLTDLDFHLLAYGTDLASGDVAANVRIPTGEYNTGLSNLDPIARLYYSASESSTEDEAGTYAADCEAAYNWDGDAHDSTSNGNDGTLQGGASASGGVLTLDGSGDWVTSAGGTETRYTNLTIINGSSFTGGCGIFGTGEGGAYDRELAIEPNYSTLRARHYDGGAKETSIGSTALTTATNHSVASRYDGTDLKAFLDGAEEGTVAAGNPYTGYSSPTWYQGAVHNAGGIFGGINQSISGSLQATQRWSVALSADWIEQFHNWHLDAADTWQLGAEQGGGNTATSAVTIGAATCSASATFAPGTKTATAACTVGAATCAAAATVPFQATAALQLGGPIAGPFEVGTVAGSDIVSAFGSDYAWANGLPVIFGPNSSGLTPGLRYFIRDLATNGSFKEFALAEYVGGPVVDITGSELATDLFVGGNTVTCSAVASVPDRPSIHSRPRQRLACKLSPYSLHAKL